MGIEREKERGRREGEAVDCSKLGIGTAYRYLLTGKPHTHVHKPTRSMHPVCCKEPVKYVRSVPEGEINPSQGNNITNLYLKTPTSVHRMLC